MDACYIGASFSQSRHDLMKVMKSVCMYQCDNLSRTCHQGVRQGDEPLVEHDMS